MKNKVIGFLSFGAVAASILAACSSSSSGGSAAADACTDYANAIIGYEAKCEGIVDSSKTSDLSARYVTQCKSILALNGIGSLGSALSSCASALNGASCSTSFDQIDACQLDSQVGTLATGSPCFTDYQCSSGSCPRTASTDGGADSDCGTCAAAIPDGGDCTNGSCVQGDECDGEFGSDGTLTYTCKPKTAPGDLGATCNSTGDCKAPNHCTFGSSDTGTCSAPVASGGACESSEDCSTGLICIEGASSGTGEGGNTCGAPKQVGDACTGYDCDIGLTCDTASTNKCVKVTFAAAGASCDGSTVLCSVGGCPVTSSDTTGTCPTVIADGQACDSSDDSTTCDSYAECVNGKCTLTATTCN